MRAATGSRSSHGTAPPGSMWNRAPRAPAAWNRPMSSSVAPSSSPATTTPTTNPPAPPITNTYSGVGGSITVRLQNGSLTLVSYNAASGFVADVRKASGSRVEVRFESNDQRTEIRVDIVGNGMSAQVDES